MHPSAVDLVDEHLPALEASETDGLDTLEAADAPSTPEGDELEDFDYDGKVYQAPKGLKGAFLRQADYTRKTQELAAERRAVEVERAQHGEAQEARAGLVALRQKIAACEATDWDALQRSDPEAAQRLYAHLGALSEAHDHLAGELAGWEQSRTMAEHQAHAQRVQAGQAVLARDIEGWSPRLAGQLANFAVSEFGVSPEELAEVHDPRLVKLLHAAYVAANAGQLNRQAQRHVDAQTSRPAATVGGRAQAGKDPNRMTTEEWMRHRNSQLHKQR